MLEALDGLGVLEAPGAHGWADMAPGAQLELLHELGCLRERVERAAALGLAAVHGSGAAEDLDGLVAKGWYSHRVGCARSTATRALSLGQTLERFPAVAAAVAAGELSVDHVHVLAAASNPRVREQLEAIDPQLRDLATGSTVEQWRRDLQSLVRLVDTDGAPPPDPRDVDTATVTTTPDGALLVRGEFSGDQALVIRSLVDQEVDRQRRLARSETDHVGIAMPTAAVLRARAVAELFRRAASHGAGAGTAPASEAVVVIDTTRPLVPVPSDTLGWSGELGRLAAMPRATTPAGEPVPPHTAALVACHANLSALVVDDEGRPLRFGRARRWPSPDQRLVLAVRDGGCVFPGCDAPPEWCDAHHVRMWLRDVGGTDVEVLALLCRRHHGLAHSSKWSLAVDACEHGHVPGRPPDRPGSPGAVTVPGEGRRRDDGAPDVVATPGDRPAPACPVDATCPGSHTFTWTHLPTGRTFAARSARTRGVR